jgi:large subunit ribosomal protein L29
MKAKELRELSDADLQQKLIDTRQELFNLRFQSVTGALENPARITHVKRDIARIITIRAERQAALERH